MTRIEFEHKILKMRPKMLRVATDFFHNEEDVEDIVQEVYSNALHILELNTARLLASPSPSTGGS